MDSIVERYEKQLKAKIIAVDFDNTITLPCPYPNACRLDKRAKKYLDKLHEKGYRLILWSARIEKDYEDAYNMCVNDYGMPYIEKDSNDPYTADYIIIPGDSYLRLMSPIGATPRHSIDYFL